MPKTSRISWIWIAGTFAAAILFAARDLSFALKLGAEGGWDLDAACASFAALSEGKDPYILKNIETSLPFPYAIVTAYPAKFLCPIHAIWPNAYIIIYL